MSPSTTRRWLQLSHLLLAAGYVSATTLTLTNFEDIAPKVAVKGCRTAYDTPLTNCGVDDFSNGNKCSSDCKSSIAEVQSNIQTECEGVSVNSDSLLYRAQKGQLQQVICLNGSDDDEDEPATTTAKVPTSKSNENQMIETSEVETTALTADVPTQTTLTAQTTSLVLAGGESTGLVSDATSSAAAAAETTKSSSRGGDPFASNSDSDDASGSGPASRVGYATLVISAVVCMMAVI
ncbi:hypothetical protein AK830_g8042 [Neonectria ditissima]|uniref:Extracellular membrane protein CFEM domain-containing protein n=1 Tax=Neonectria ditissima TaxID=78410 RepID=A0A0P7BF07_9HYPO|nr:hypothetical protein AK830_g8042 [Neonectria ditissima]